MKNFQEIENNIKKIKSFLQNNYNIKELALFGSYLRNEQTDKSDIDILVDFNEATGLLKFINLKNYLKNYLGTEVDLVMKNGIKKELTEDILSDAYYL